MRRPFRQVDVFTQAPYLGNPLAVVLGADGLNASEMQRFASWTNLSETTFVVEPDSALAVWFRERVGTLKGRTRRIAIVAMARKLLIALWRYVETGVVPAGVVLRSNRATAA